MFYDNNYHRFSTCKIKYALQMKYGEDKSSTVWSGFLVSSSFNNTATVWDCNELQPTEKRSTLKIFTDFDFAGVFKSRPQGRTFTI